MTYIPPWLPLMDDSLTGLCAHYVISIRVALCWQTNYNDNTSRRDVTTHSDDVIRWETGGEVEVTSVANAS